MEVLRARCLSRTYSKRVRGSGFLGTLRAYFSNAMQTVPAVQDVSFAIEQGEAVGLIGENGAGKSTLIKMLTGILAPSSGEVETLGVVPAADRRRLSMSIGAVFGQKPQLLWDIPTGESFKLLKAMYHIPDSVYRHTFHETVERLSLGRLLDTPVRQLSLGQRMRCDLAAALLHAPRIAFLDEPTIGLDVAVKEDVRQYLRDMRQRFGTTIVLTTHDLKDITAACERVLVLDRGQLKYDGSLSGFVYEFSMERTVLVEVGHAPSEATGAAFAAELAPLGVTLDWQAAQRLRIVCPNPAFVPMVTSTALRHLQITDLTLQAPDIDSIVARMYRADVQRMRPSP